MPPSTVAMQRRACSAAGATGMRPLRHRLSTQASVRGGLLVRARQGRYARGVPPGASFGRCRALATAATSGSEGPDNKCHLKRLAFAAQGTIRGTKALSTGDDCRAEEVVPARVLAQPARGAVLLGYCPVPLVAWRAGRQGDRGMPVTADLGLPATRIQCLEIQRLGRAPGRYLPTTVRRIRECPSMIDRPPLAVFSSQSGRSARVAS